MNDELHGIWKEETEKKERITSVSITRILTDIKPGTVRYESEVLPLHQTARLGQS